jgi:signal transduction histidine kinase
MAHGTPGALPSLRAPHPGVGGWTKVEIRRQELLMAIYRNMVELQAGIDRCRRLIDSVLDESIDEAGLVRLKEHLEGAHQDSRLRNALREAIFVLDESRKAFKSKQLENLRKRLTRALAEN